MRWLLLITNPSVPLSLIGYIQYFDTNKDPFKKKKIMKDEEVKTNLAEFWKRQKNYEQNPRKKQQ